MDPQHQVHLIILISQSLFYSNVTCFENIMSYSEFSKIDSEKWILQLWKFWYSYFFKVEGKAKVDQNMDDDTILRSVYVFVLFTDSEDGILIRG